MYSVFWVISKVGVNPRLLPPPDRRIMRMKEIYLKVRIIRERIYRNLAQVVSGIIETFRSGTKVFIV